MLVLGAALAIIPYVPWGQYLSSSVSGTGSYKRQKVVTDINPVNGAGSGKAVNINDLATYPPNSSWLVTYPSSGDLTVDSQNPDTFVKWQLIRLPAELGGDKPAVDAFVAFSKVCVHLWCSPNYDPEKSSNPTNETYQCPCHGSIYRIPDGLSIAGPASLQSPPTNAIPMLTLSSDSGGDLYIEVPTFDVNHNGVVGYGRYYDTYETYIKPAEEGSASTSTASAGALG
ncbi:MAG: Rieske 2Fe-2S domain-containing protein [Nitrososphaerota archaeon]|nr:Rieske 2Fe-2S domain-containing protein [Nitrososphaerota archaeon]